MNIIKTIENWVGNNARMTNIEHHQHKLEDVYKTWTFNTDNGEEVVNEYQTENNSSVFVKQIDGNTPDWNDRNQVIELFCKIV
ncbi:MAG TPA: hypothetical protein GX497_03490 [Bacillus bacterium]|nr:hypothetical protein [Bacillus sp. (in: firmicutes)]